MNGHRAHLVPALILLACGTVELPGADIFRFFAPPGSLALNASYEFAGLEYLSFTVEHEGVGISDWFVTLSKGQAATFEPRVMNQGADLLSYQVYKEEPPSTRIIKDTSAALSADNVVTGSDFSAFAAVMEQKTFSMVVHIPEGQFVPAGSYLDTVVLSLYTGTFAASTLVDSAMVNLSGRTASLLDIQCQPDSGIMNLDLTADHTDFSIGTVIETSNAGFGYTVAVTSLNFAADSAGHADPYFKHQSGDGFLEYQLSYGGLAVGGWAGGTAQVTDSGAITPAAGLSSVVTITFSGDGSLPAGSYKDILTFTITAK